MRAGLAFLFDLDGEQLFESVHFDGDHPAARRCLDYSRFHLLLQLLLHLLRLLHQLLHVHD